MKIDLLLNNALMEQSPGFLGVLSPDSKLLMVNTVGLEWIGYTSDTFESGTSYENLRCRAAEHADLFMWQDDLVKKNNKSLYFIGCYCYSDNNWRVIFGKKYPLKDENENFLGIVSQFDDITSFRMVEINRFLMSHKNKSVTNAAKDQYCYILDDYLNPNLLSTRELECLFFMLRGKAIKTIAKILALSPRTVESYVEQIKSKLFCHNKEEMIEKAIHEGYLSVLPNTLLQKNIISFI